MAFAIPKIEYKNVTRTGDTHTNTTIDDLSSTSDLEAGMTVTGSGVPTGATIVSVDSASAITISAATTSSLNNTSLSFAHVISFDYPPKEDKGDSKTINSATSVSLSGVRQVSVNHTEVIRAPIFSFLSPTLYTSMVTFLDSHACLGEAFRYYEDKTSGTYTDYELKDLKYDPKKIAPRSTTTYVWEIALRFRRVA